MNFVKPAGLSWICNCFSLVEFRSQIHLSSHFSVLLRDLVAAVSESSNDSASRIYLDTLLSIVGKLISYDFDCFKQLVPTFLDVPRLVQDENTDVLVRTVLGNLKRIGHDTVVEAFSMTFLHMFDAANATAGADDNARSVLLPDNEWTAIRETVRPRFFCFSFCPLFIVFITFLPVQATRHVVGSWPGQGIARRFVPKHY
jgi:hypothetical protein